MFILGFGDCRFFRVPPLFVYQTLASSSIFWDVLCGAAICGLMLGIVMRVISTPLESSSRFMPAIVGGVGGSYIGIIAPSINYSDPLLRWGSMLCSAVLCGLILGIAMRVTFKLKKHRQQEENENA